MPQLSTGAVALPMHHVSVRVPWHDTDWTERVCSEPAANHSCTVLRRIKQGKDVAAEQAAAGCAFLELEHGPPPCVWERGGFMRAKAATYSRSHPYGKQAPYAHFAETTQRMAPYSLEVIPFRWMLSGECERYTQLWGMEVDRTLEGAINDQLGFQSPWMQDHRNQRALLDSFFSALRPRQSLVLLYAKDVPLVEEREPRARYLIGAGFVEAVEPAVEWSYSSSRAGGARSIMFERGVAHTIRATCADGFLLPYQQLLATPDLVGEDLTRFLARAPAEHVEEFSYGSELVSHDGAIGALVELARVVELLAEVVDGPWARAGRWIADRLAETWHARGPYPGMAVMLAAAGLERGPVLARRVLESLPAGTADPWPAIERAIAENLGGLVGRTSRKVWERLTPDRYRQLRVMSRFALTPTQGRELFERLPPEVVIDNPYVLAEQGGSEPVAFTTIDRGLWPQDADARAALQVDPIEEPVNEPADERRVRAASIHVLERAAGEGHSLLDEAGLRKRLAALALDPLCDPANAAWEVAVEEFAARLVERQLARGAGRGWQLERLAAVSDLIAAEVHRRCAAAPLAVSWDWAGRIGEVLPRVERPDAAEQRARAEKTRALETIVRSRISALVGPAGTGKTTMLEALCADPAIEAAGVLLLAPTGKAAVQLQARTGRDAQNLAQFLRAHGRWEWDSGAYHLAPDEGRYRGAQTVVIDEASMLTEEMLGATIDALANVERLILCGDPRQLPPIGAGRPFADLVAFLGAGPGPGGGLAELSTGRRQAQAHERDRPPDDVAIASLFSVGAALPGAEDALRRVLAGQGDGRIEIHTWTDEADLHAKLLDALLADPNLGLDGRSRGALCRSLGAECEDDGLPRFPWGEAGAGAERWQLLSPVRARVGGVVGLNELVRGTWRAGDVQLARRSFKFFSPAGADQVIFADKVMCLRNDHRRKATDPQTWTESVGSVANGEVGLIVKKAGKSKPLGHTVEFSTQPGRQYTFGDRELNGEDERGEWLELAYAVTVHKSQGSQFRVVYVVIPDPCPLLSPELLYTALTRQRDKVVLFKQGDAATLWRLTSPALSETARRLTCLFSPADPLAVGDSPVLDGAHVHRTARGDDLVRSKSEVIVADALHDLGLEYGYEVELTFPGELPLRPDFTIPRPAAPPVYWEHLGMLDRAGYRAAWDARKAWYADHGILPWEEGGGPAGMLVCSDENVDGQGISSHGIRQLARAVFGLS